MHDILFLHSSAFMLNDKSFIINAFGGSGKTNLLLDVLELGGYYFADDLCAVSTSNFLYPYLKRINMLDYNFQYKPYLLERLNKKSYKKLLRLNEIFKRYDNRIVGKIRRRAASKLNLRVDYKAISDKIFCKRNSPIDYFIWLERFKETYFNEDIIYFRFHQCAYQALDSVFSRSRS